VTARAGAIAAPSDGRALLLLLAFTEGAAVMIAELVGAKMLAPLYGSSLYVWGAVIGITLISLTAGYYLGGLLSYRKRRREMVYWFMLTAALLIVLMPTVAHQMMTAIGDMETIRAILLLTSIYLLPPLLLLGATPPLIISILANEVHESGNVAGRVYAISTVGGILATFGAGFWLIPEFGLTRTAIAGGIGLSILPLVLLVGRRHWPALVYPVLLVAILMPRGATIDHPRVDILYESEGLLGQLKVMDIGFPRPDGSIARTDRILFVNRTGQTWINRDTGEPIWDYVKFLTTIGSLAPEGSRTLLLGLGGGIVAKKMQQLGHTVDSVELDERIAKIARDYFGLEHSGDVIVDDGRHFLRSTDRRYDLIIFDVFQAEVPPAHMLTLEAFRELHGLLNPGGFVVINYSGFITGSTGIGARSIYKTLLEAGWHVDLLPTGLQEDTRNNLMIASDGSLDFNRPRVPITVSGRIQPLPRFFMDPAEIDTDDALILRDNRPVLEKLNLEPAAIWRKAYYEHFTKRFLDMGIPLFE
jgi:predicted membrane-bound spermidine synthase